VLRDNRKQKIDFFFIAAILFSAMREIPLQGMLFLSFGLLKRCTNGTESNNDVKLEGDFE